MEEIWKDIPEYEGLYQASNLGRIRTHKDKTTYTERHGVRKWKTRIMKGRGNNKVTGSRVGLWKDGKVKDFLVARLVALTFLGKPITDKNTVNHINGNRLDNRVDNLEWLSLADNIRHAFDTGLMPCKKIKVFNDKEEHVFISKTRAGIYFGFNHGYISSLIKRGKNSFNKNGVKYFVEEIK